MTALDRREPDAGGIRLGVEAATKRLNDVSTVQPDSDSSEQDARRLTEKIRLRLTVIAENIDAVLALIETARTTNAHEALNYRSWTQYVENEFGGLLARLTKAERLPVIGALADQGMSTRAIGKVVGVSHMTVARQLEASGVTNVTGGRVVDVDVDKKRTTPPTVETTNTSVKPTSRSRSDKVVRIAALAAEGCSSRQIATEVGITDKRVRHIAREHDVTIPADASVGNRPQGFDSQHIVDSIVDGLEGTRMSLEYVEFGKVDVSDELLDSLAESLRVLRALHEQLRLRTTQEIITPDPTERTPRGAPKSAPPSLVKDLREIRKAGMFALWKTLAVAFGKQGLVDLEQYLFEHRPISLDDLKSQGSR